MDTKRRIRGIIFAGLSLIILLGVLFLWNENRKKLPTSITWCYVSGEEGEQRHVEWVAQRFRTRYPDIELKLERLPSDIGPDILNSRIASDDAPDVFYISGLPTFRDYEASGHLYDLSGQPFLKNLDNDFLKYGQVNGKQVVVTASFDVLGIVYNKDLFERYQIRIPQTYSELIDVCRRLEEEGIVPFATGFQTAWTAEAFFMNFAEVKCAGQDAKWYSDKMNLHSSFQEDEAFKNAFESMYGLKPYFSADPMEADWNDALELMLNGKAAMICGGSWAVDGILGKDPDMNIGIFATPVSENKDDTKLIIIPAGGNVLFQSEDEEKVRAGLMLMNEIYSEEALEHEIITANRFISTASDEIQVFSVWQDVEQYIKRDQVFNRGGIDAFTSEYFHIMRKELIRFIAYEEADADGFAASLDAGFQARSRPRE